MFSDRKVVSFATNVFPESMPDTVVRLQADGTLRHQCVPPLLPAYNKYMGGVDRTGQKRKLMVMIGNPKGIGLDCFSTCLI